MNAFSSANLDNLHASYQIIRELGKIVDLSGKTEDIVIVSPDTGAIDRNKFYASGLVTLALDMAKTVAAMLIGKALAGVTGEAISGAFCIIGHCFPLYFGFRGGKGVSVGAGLGLMTGLYVFGVIIAVFALTAGLSRKVSLGSMLAALTLPIASVVFGAEPELITMNAFSAALVIVMHRENIGRLINGTEADFKPGKAE